jgi:hypothetical protein
MRMIATPADPERPTIERHLLYALRMGRFRQSTMRNALADPVFLLWLAAIALSLLRAADLPGIELHAGGTAVTVVPTDIALVALAVSLGARIVRTGRYPRAAVATTAAAGAFALLILGTGAANGSSPFVAAGKLVELVTLLVAAVVLIDRVERLWIVVAVLVGITTIAVAWGVVGWVQSPGRRQAAFLGEHDFAALSTASLVVGLAALHGRHRLGRLPLVAGIAGAIGITLGAALASLLGLYLAGAALVAVAAARGTLRLRPVVVTVLVALSVTAGTYGLRSNELGFLHEWFAPAKNAQPGQYAASWSQRLIFSYIGGRIFLSHPVLGTGWWGELPPSEYARYLPAARKRFSDQPPRYFPRKNGTFIPQQTYDQVLYELGLVGIAALLALAVSSGRDVRRAARSRRYPEADEIVAYLPAGWLASLAGVLSGAALFGGTPIAGLFWLTLGLVAAIAALAAGDRRHGTPSPGPADMPA